MWTPRPYTTDCDAIVLPLYIVFALYHVFNQGKTYRSHHTALRWHIAAGTAEVTLYYIGCRCSLISVTACLIHSWTSLILVNGLPNGYPPHTRPSYQTGAVMRPLQIIWAYYTQDPLDYHDAIVPIHSFVYARALIFLLGSMGPSMNFSKNVNSRYVYAQAILGSALMAVGHCSRPTAVAEYLLLFHGLGKLGVWTKRQYDESRKNGVPASPLVKTLLWLGFVTRGDALMESSIPNPRIVPEIGNLAMDSIGHQWAEFN